MNLSVGRAILSLSITAFILTQSQNGVTQTMRDRQRGPQKHELSEREVRRVITLLQSKGEAWTESEIDYVVKNINRPELQSSLEKWEKNRSAIITTKARISLLIDYLLTELAGLKALPSYLDGIGTDQDRVGVSDRWKIEVAASTPSPSEYGRLRLVTIPQSSEVYIDGDFEDYSDKEFVLAVGTYSVSVKREGFRDFSTKVEIERRKTRVVQCELVKK